jgi:hypothetical protein
MALRPFLTAGVAFATAGAVAATVAIAPPLSPGDRRVVNDTEVALNADLRDLINTYFGQFPGDPDNPGTIHFFGVLQQLLQNATVDSPEATALIDAYFEEGLADVIRQLLVQGFPDQDAPVPAIINAYFNDGLADATRVYLDQFATPEQQEWIDTYFGDPDHVNDDGSTNVSQNGASGIAWKVLNELGLTGELRENLDTFFNAQTANNPQAIPITTPVLREDPPGSGNIVPVEGPDGEPLTSEFKPVLVDGEPQFDPVTGEQLFTTELLGWYGNSNPARRGTWGVIYNVIDEFVPDDGPAQDVLDAFWDGGISEVVKVVLIALSPDPFADKLITDYFDEGIDKVVQTLLTEGTPEDSPYHQLVDEYFDNGITGVVRYLLTGPIPEEEGPPVPPETMMLRVGSAEQASEDEGLEGLEGEGIEVNTLEDTGTPGDVSTLIATVEKTFVRKPVRTEVSAPIVPVVTPAPVPEVTPAPAPEVTPAPIPSATPAPAPESSTQVKDEESEEDETATNVKTGNKVEPIIILPGGASKSKGGGAWGWNGLADRVNGFVKGVQKGAGGGAPAAADPGAGGTPEGGE